MQEAATGGWDGEKVAGEEGKKAAEVVTAAGRKIGERGKSPCPIPVSSSGLIWN